MLFHWVAAREYFCRFKILSSESRGRRSTPYQGIEHPGIQFLAVLQDQIEGSESLSGTPSRKVLWRASGPLSAGRSTLSFCIGQRSLSRRCVSARHGIKVPRPNAYYPPRSLSSYALRMRSPMPSADMRSNRCVPLRGTSAGYASASSASIRLLKSGSQWLCVAAMGEQY
jgi:hypothetical protein